MSHAITGPSTKAHAPALDGLRGLAVLLVVAHHAELPWAPFPVELGLVGVRLFFVLSGFLITGILLEGRDAIEGGRATRGSFARAFYARRALRIFPVYYLSLAVLVALDAPLVREQLGWHALYATSLLVAREGHWVGVASHFWSLSVEEQFYLLWPWLVLATPRRHLGWTCGALVIAAPLFRLVGALAGIGRFGLVFTLPGCLDALALGALFAWLHRTGSPRLPELRATIAAGGGVLLSLATTASVLLVDSPLLSTVEAAHGLSHALLAAALVSGCATIAPASISSSRPWRAAAALLTWRPLRYVGRVSYALYVVHPMIPYGLSHRGIDPWPMPVRVLSYFVVPLAIAALSDVWLESRVLALKGRFPYAGP